MKRLLIATTCLLAASSNAISASTASQREYKRGYADCIAGRWDENQHGASYKKGCRAAEGKRGAGGSAAATDAASGSPAAMLDKCRARAASAYKASGEAIQVKYEGQRVDGTHAVNGSVEGRDPAATFQCSFNRSGAKIVTFTRVKAVAYAAQPLGPQTGDVPNQDKKACVQALKKLAHNVKIVVTGTESSEANNSVTMALGPNRAPWSCLVKNGKVADLMSLIDEGNL